jgi:hypothetical protein
MRAITGKEVHQFQQVILNFCVRKPWQRVAGLKVFGFGVRPVPVAKARSASLRCLIRHADAVVQING